MLVPAQGLPLAATLRGLELLHAAGVALAGGVVLMAGEPGAGKTSLAAALVRRGGALLSDDAVALELRDDALLAHPGSALLQLREPEHARLSPAQRTASGAADGAVAGKRRVVPRRADAPAPPLALCLLERSSEQPALERLAQVDPFALLATTFNLSVRTPERLARHLDLCARIAASVPVHRVRVQPGVDADALADLLLAHLGERAAA